MLRALEVLRGMGFLEPAQDGIMRFAGSLMLLRHSREAMRPVMKAISRHMDRMERQELRASQEAEYQAALSEDQQRRGQEEPAQQQHNPKTRERNPVLPEADKGSEAVTISLQPPTGGEWLTAYPHRLCNVMAVHGVV